MQQAEPRGPVVFRGTESFVDEILIEFALQHIQLGELLFILSFQRAKRRSNKN